MDADFADTTEQALVRKPRPVGWFVAGMVTIAAVTGFAAYYLPLQSAHATLTSEHRQLAKKAGELDHSLKSDRAVLQATEGRREQLQKFIDEGVEEESRHAASYDVLKATLERELGPQLAWLSKSRGVDSVCSLVPDARPSLGSRTTVGRAPVSERAIPFSSANSSKTKPVGGAIGLARWLDGLAFVKRSRTVLIWDVPFSKR